MSFEKRFTRDARCLPGQPAVSRIGSFSREPQGATTSSCPCGMPSEDEAARIRMSKYDELYEVVRQRMPALIATDRAIREFPHKLKNVIRAYIQSPNGVSTHATIWFGCPTEYVDLYYSTLDAKGRTTHLRKDIDFEDGIFSEVGQTFQCCIGICLHDASAHEPLMAFIYVDIENAEGTTLAFSVKNVDGQFVITDVTSAESYSTVAKQVIDRVVGSVKDSPRGGLHRNPIGFGPWPTGGLM